MVQTRCSGIGVQDCLVAAAVIVQAGRLHLPQPVVEGIGHVSTETSRC